MGSSRILLLLLRGGSVIEFIAMRVQSTPPAGDSIDIDLGDIE